MVIQAGAYRLGPHNATLAVHTRRGGAAAKAGHDLVIHVTSWEGTLEAGDAPGSTAIELAVDATSLRVHEGRGGVQSLGDDDKANIEQTIDDEVLKRRDITFRSTRVTPAAGGGNMSVEGDLTLAGATRPITFELAVGDDGDFSASAVLTQSLWGMKPYSTLFGALKVLDDVEVVLHGHRP